MKLSIEAMAMLQALELSDNELVANNSRSLLYGSLDSDEYIKQCGSFMKAVLHGDVVEARHRADGDNIAALDEYYIMYYKDAYDDLFKKQSITHQADVSAQKAAWLPNMFIFERIGDIFTPPNNGI